MKKESSFLKIGIGTPTILMIFVVLCMVILSVLSYQEANHNRLLVEKEKRAVIDYYEAVDEANEIRKKLMDHMVDDSVVEDESCFMYDCDIDGGKFLHVVVDKSSFDYLSFVVMKRGD